MTRGDKLLIIVVVILSITSIFLIKNNIFGYKEKIIRIEIDGSLYEEIAMDEVEGVNKKLIKSKLGTNEVEYSRDYIRVVDASCPDKLDVKQGSISEVGQMIVCLPNKLVIEIQGEENSEVDKISR